MIEANDWFGNAGDVLAEAVDVLRRAGKEQFLPRGPAGARREDRRVGVIRVPRIKSFAGMRGVSKTRAREQRGTGQSTGLREGEV